MTKQDAIKYISSLPENSNISVMVNDYLTSGEVEILGISRQLLHYWVRQGYVRTEEKGKQKRYLKEDIIKMRSK